MRIGVVGRALVLGQLVAAFVPGGEVGRRRVSLRGTFRDAQRELMDGGAEVELSGDAWLAEAQALDFIAANVEMRTNPKCTAGVAVKNAGRAIADVGAKFRNKGGLELAAYAMDEAGVYMGECSKALRKLEDAAAGAAADAALSVSGALESTSKGLYEQSPQETGVALLLAADCYDALASHVTKVPALEDAAPRLATGADRLRAGGRVLTGKPDPAAPPKKPRRW